VVQGKRYIIIGDGAAGITAARVLRNADPLAHIGMLSDDPQPAYYRAALTNYLLGELREEHLWAVPPTFFAEYRAERHMARVTSVDTTAKTIALSSGQSMPYDKLLVASGSRARPPPFPGGQAQGVLTLRTMQDARLSMDLVVIHELPNAVVVGGGPLAIEWAVALAERGLAVKLFVRGGRILQGAVDQVGSDLVLTRMRQHGIDVRTHEEVAQVVAGADGRVTAVCTKKGETIACGLVGVAIGVVCNSEFLNDGKVKLGEGGTVLTDNRMQSSSAEVFAAGDVAQPPSGLLQLWEPAQRQALVAAANMTGKDERYDPGAFYFATRLADLDFASVGETDSSKADEELSYIPSGTGTMSYRKVLVKDGKLIGAIMLGEREERVRRRGRTYKRLIDAGISVAPVKDELLNRSFDLQGWLRSAALVKEPVRPKVEAGATRKPPATAMLRGTQMLQGLSGAGGSDAMAQLAAMAAAPAASPAAAATDPQTPGGVPTQSGTKMLTIGLRMPAALAPAPTATRGYLVGGDARFEIGSQVVSIGRAPTNQVVLADQSISHLHAQITLYQEELYLRDLGSRNGTWVNNQPLTIPHRLRHGDRVKLGHTELDFQSSAEQSDAPSFSSAPYARAATDSAVGSGPHLIGEGGECLGIRFALPGDQVSVGRDPDSGVRLDDISVSRRHAVLSRQGSQWFVTDMSSSRGTMKNGVAITAGQQVALNEGDRLQFGNSVLHFTN